MLHLGGGTWLATSRRFGLSGFAVFTSDDDALTQHQRAHMGVIYLSVCDLR